MNEEQIKELVTLGHHLEVRVTPFTNKGWNGVEIKGIRFTDFIAAFLYLQQVGISEVSGYRCGLVV